MECGSVNGNTENINDVRNFGKSGNKPRKLGRIGSDGRVKLILDLDFLASSLLSSVLFNMVEEGILGLLQTIHGILMVRK